ncbi:MAG: hypothetical protein HQK99_07650 [Nitrospirae bacterium]|nr:hypothetical protein [Nitrospirota bacterium]
MFQIDYFKTIADELPGLNYKNKDIMTAVSRTTIGRYYYYIFLKYRETIYSSLHENGDALYKSYSHVLIQKIMTYYGKPDMAELLHRLRRLRNDCDYEAYGIIDEDHVNYAKHIVSILDRQLTAIIPSEKLDNAFNKALSKIKVYKAIS